MAAETFNILPAEVFDQREVGDAFWLQAQKGRAQAALIFSHNDVYFVVVWAGSGTPPSPELLQRFRPDFSANRQAPQGLNLLDKAESLVKQQADKQPLDALLLACLVAEIFLVPLLSVASAYGAKSFRVRYQLAHATGTLIILAWFCHNYVTHQFVGGRGLILDIAVLLSGCALALASTLWLGWRSGREAHDASQKGRIPALRAALLSSLLWGGLGVGLLYALSLSR